MTLISDLCPREPYENLFNIGRHDYILHYSVPERNDENW